ncbi:DUF362 domain-containing protein [Heliorestis acidaminivorans]|uniref:DUF362 domain-containing protein n=1 Tax=Heliorestis acidaminivorans TaxID=553427 RepID=A0A6I0ER67_9FIRM|nr:DUF362 domain-containing protein [Heliorestis acidaminivorans]KAB2950946.1 DUF362 domain-containing protein [Heliorestis acidaminivorans]
MTELTIIYGKEPKKMVRTLLELLQPEKALPLDSRIALKPNLVLAKPATSGATTSPEIAAALIEHFQERGYKNLVIMESSWVGDNTKRAFQICGYEELSKRYDIPLIDLKDDRTIKVTYEDMNLLLCKQATEVDYLINLPVLKAHCQTRLTCSLKNLKGCIPDKEKRRYHSLGLHRPIAYLNQVLRTDLIIVDGIMGDLTFEEGGNPVEMGRIIAGFDPVLVDSYVASLIGYEVSDIEYLQISHQLGRGNLYGTETSLVELDQEKKPGRTLRPSYRVAQLAQYIEENQSCSPCYGSLIHALDRLEEKGELDHLDLPLCIGRGYHGQKEKGKAIGIGNCTVQMDQHLPGCPPSARDIVQFLRQLKK